jgi:GDSL-like Lipase/Acylhydrolase family
MLKGIFSKIIYLFYVLIIVAIALEVFLRFFSPVPVRLKGNEVVLPKNQKYTLPNEKFTKLSKNAIHTKNSVGFRGEEWDVNSKRTKIIFIGGSTTECFFIDDNKHWPFLVSKKLGPQFLVNNAGLNGHSTKGHIALLNGYLSELKPDYAFFLIGINDMATTENGGNSFDAKLTEKNAEYYVLQIEEYSRLVNLIHSFYRSYQAFKLGVRDNAEWNLKKQYNQKYLSQDEMNKVLNLHKKAQIHYAESVITLINICKKNAVKPVFITQPLLFGEGIDPTSGIDLGSYEVYNMSGKQYFQKLEMYNQTLSDLCKEQNIKCIDLAKLLPKDSKYFFDDMHFSDAGCVKVLF